jgi:hypothetical protein
MVSESDPVLPTITLPKARLVGFALRAPGATPVPDTLMVRLGLGAFEVMVTVPVAFPLALGANVTVNVVLWDAPSDTGVDIPVIENAELFTETWEIDTLDISLLVMVTTCDLVAPTVTLPKASLAGLRASNPEPVPEPVPESDRDWLPFEASLLMESVALKFAAAFGVNEMLRVVLAPAASDTGSVGEVIAKYFVETEALLTLTVALPELVAVTVRVLLVPGVTSPKSRLALARTRFPD